MHPSSFNHEKRERERGGGRERERKRERETERRNFIASRIREKVHGGRKKRVE